MPLDTLEEVLVHEMTDLLSAETQFAKALQSVAKNADSETVRRMAEEHLEETRQQAENLKRGFEILGQKPEKGVVCKGAAGIVEENSSTLKEDKPKGAIKDLMLIGGSLRIEHYEIAAYSAAIAIAKGLGKREVVQILQANLKQEQATAKKLEAAAPQFLQSAPSQPASAKTTAPKSATAKSATTQSATAKKSEASRANLAKARAAKSAK